MVKKFKVIPNIKVNYSLLDILAASFISSNNRCYIFQLEKALCDFFKTDSVMMTSSGRSAIYHILVNLPQHKVIVPAYTCDVVVEAAKLANKRVVYSHVNKKTLNMDVYGVDSDCIVIATHLFGIPCDIKNICDMCKEKGAVVIEDCAGSFGSKIEGKLTGTFGDYAVFSFSASKFLNAPTKGGFIIAKRNKDIYELKRKVNLKKCDLRFKTKNIIKSFAFCFDKNAYFHYLFSKMLSIKKTSLKTQSLGTHISAEIYTPSTNVLREYNYGFYNWQAYVVLKQLRKLSSLIKNKEELIKQYNTINKQCVNHFVRPSTCIRYPVFISNRDAKLKLLREKGVEFGYGFDHFVCPSNFVEELTMAKEIAYLPFSSNFTKKEIDYIMSVLYFDFFN